jgi:tetratricopeptide (TPR) repeat protein
MKKQRKDIWVFSGMWYMLFLLVSCSAGTEISPKKSDNPSLFITKGVLYLREYDSGDTDALRRAAAAFEIASQINPDLPEVYDGLGCVALREGRVEASKDFFNRATLVDPAYARAWVHKAYVAELQGEHDRAEEFLRTALRINAFEVHALTNLAGVLIDRAPHTESGRKEIQSLIHRAHELSSGESDIVTRNLKLSE